MPDYAHQPSEKTPPARLGVFCFRVSAWDAFLALEKLSRDGEILLRKAGPKLRE